MLLESASAIPEGVEMMALRSDGLSNGGGASRSSAATSIGSELLVGPRTDGKTSAPPRPSAGALMQAHFVGERSCCTAMNRIDGSVSADVACWRSAQDRNPAHTWRRRAGMARQQQHSAPACQSSGALTSLSAMRPRSTPIVTRALQEVAAVVRVGAEGDHDWAPCCGR